MHRKLNCSLLKKNVLVGNQLILSVYHLHFSVSCYLFSDFSGGVSKGGKYSVIITCWRSNSYKGGYRVIRGLTLQ